LGELIHGLWLVRVSAKELTATAESSVGAADAAYSELSRVARTRPQGELLAGMKPHRHLFEQFRDACQKVGAAMSEFPHEIKVV
jgi:hypothetical protein